MTANVTVIVVVFVTINVTISVIIIAVIYLISKFFFFVLRVLSDSLIACSRLILKVQSSNPDGITHIFRLDKNNMNLLKLL